jgi:dsDNA-specific endonuclease/ATPase MutS2
MVFFVLVLFERIKEMNIEKQIEFDRVKEIWSGLTHTGYAKNMIKEAGIILDETQLNKALRDTGDAREIIERQGTPPLQDVTEIWEILHIAKRGECLTPFQLEKVERVLAAVRRLKVYLSCGQAYENSLAFYDENLDELEELQREISSQIRNESVDDRASKFLYDTRNEIRRLEDAMKQKAEQVIRNNKACMADSYYTMRNGRICVPVKKEYKLKVSGSVIDRSSTGSTLFIEPAGVAGLYEERELQLIAEANEVSRILYTLTVMVADAASAMEEDVRMMEKLDFIFSKGRLSLELFCTAPIINTDRIISLSAARHPLMDREENVPLDFSLGGSERGIVITGPNTGGKTVAIKTVMLNCYMAQCGLHVTCEKAEIAMNDHYLCDIGDGQNLSENLSTFSAHIKNVIGILELVTRNSFVIMDELGSGTDPAEGMGIATAILEELRKRGANFLVTTHYPEIKGYADRTEGIKNARMTFDKETLKPTYKMVIGEAGESCAFYIADRLGMPESMLKTAVEAAYGKKALEDYEFSHNDELKKTGTKRIKESKKTHADRLLVSKFSIGDSVMISPEQKIAIVCEPANEKGVLRVQVAKRKIYINQKRVKLLVKADKLYPKDYDFSIIFDSVQNRKIRHDMERKFTDEVIREN